MKTVARIAAATLAVLFMSVLVAPSSGAGRQGPQVTISKTVVGPSEPGLTFEIEVTCGPTTATIELMDGESETISFPFDTVCTVTETVTQGADSVEYSCDEIDGVQCLSDNSFQALLNGVPLPEVEVDIVNSFDPEPSSSVSSSTTTAPAAQPAVVARPRFTG